MEFFTGLDVGMDETAICVVDDKGKVALEVSVVTDPDAIKATLMLLLGRLRRVGHEAGALSPWLHPELLNLGLPAVCLETQQRLLLTHRRDLKRKFLDLENAIRHLLKAFGIRIKGTGRGGFAQTVREAVAGDALVDAL
jgi:transposase